MRAMKMFGPPRALAVLLVLPATALPLAGGCRRDAGLGLPDSYLVYAPAVDKDGTALKSASGLPIVEPLALDDQRAVPLHQQVGVGIVGELLRTDYLAKELVRDLTVNGATYPAAARAVAGQPTLFMIGRGMPPLGNGFATKGFFGGAADRPDLPWIGLREDLADDRALPQSVSGLLARRLIGRVVDPASSPVLVDGYVRAMEVIAREWRVGQGPQGAVAPDAGTGTQRALFAGVRENQFAVGPDGAPRPASELLADPGLAATVIYRMAQSKLVGKRVAPADVYAPFVKDRVPPGVSPAAVLGPFRNFQAKLLTAWARAALAGTPPHDVADLVEAYGRAMPDERGEAFRIFVVTTYGATVKPGGVDASGPRAAAALPELTALAAEVAAGRRSSRAALPAQR
jgi:hypothetical protein